MSEKRVSQRQQRRIAVMASIGLLQEGERPTRQEWERFQKTAVEQLLKFSGNADLALRSLGVKLDTLDRLERRKIVAAVYGDQRLIEKTQVDYKNLDLQKDEIIARQIQIALSGSSEESTRAAFLLAKIGGWLAATKVEGTVKGVTLHAFASNKDMIAEFLQATSHEPGEAIAIQSEVVSDTELTALPPVIEDEDEVEFGVA